MAAQDAIRRASGGARGGRPTKPTVSPCRIAVVTHFDRQLAQQCLAGVYRRASRSPGVVIETFDDLATDFAGKELPRLLAWQPHGLIVRMHDAKRLGLVRRKLPGLPCVATAALPRDLVDAVVVGSACESFIAARNCYRKCGIEHVALFTVAADHAMKSIRSTFHEVVPGGLEVICPWDVFEDSTRAGARRRHEIVAKGLRALPKPVGIIAAETEAAAFLLTTCQTLGLKVPDEVQIIGVDQEDRCLACYPHLSSIEVPSGRIGQVAVDTVLRLIRGEQPAPPPVIRVSGSRVVARGTTRSLSVGSTVAKDAIDLMRSDVTKGLTASDLAKRVSVGRATLYRTFAATTGTTPARHLRQLRLQEACRLLRETDEPVAAIAEMCGFSSIEAFLNFFRRGLSTTPTLYRNANRAAARPRKAAVTRRPSS